MKNHFLVLLTIAFCSCQPKTKTKGNEAIVPIRDSLTHQLQTIHGHHEGLGKPWIWIPRVPLQYRLWSNDLCSLVVGQLPKKK